MITIISTVDTSGSKVSSGQVFFHLLAATVSFEQLAYIADEDDEKVEPVLALSNPSSFDITVQVFSTNGSATGKQLTILCTIIE